MKKYSYLVLLFISVIIVSCNDDEKSSSLNPLKKYLNIAGFTEVESFIDDGDYEFGIKFAPLVNGSITSLVVKIPDDRTDLRVTLWDVETKAILNTITIPSVTADQEKKHKIPAISIVKDTEYMITFNSNDYYYRTKPDGGVASYPIVVRSISVLGYGYASSASQIYPYSFNTDYYAGDLSFSFTPSE